MACLLDPLEISGLRLKNRLVMPPMQTSFATTRGEVTDKILRHYTRRSEALGLLIVEHSYVAIDGKLSKRQLGIYDDQLISGLKKLARSVHATGTPIAIQINHAGRAAKAETTGATPVAPSPTKSAQELRIDEIEALTEAFAKAADRAFRAGFDAVEIHGAHGFLLDQFASPLINKRRDKYGGSLENRTRFPLQVVERVREDVGENCLLYRLGADDLDPKGFGVEEAKRLAVKLEEAGVNVIDVSGGVCGSRPAQLQGRQGYFIPQAEQIKGVVDVPVIGVGGITQPEYANRLVEEGRVDLVAVGRALLRDPDWAIKAVRLLQH